MHMSALSLTLSSTPPPLAVPSPPFRCFVNSQPFKLLPVGTRTTIIPNALAVNYSSPISVFPAEACETVGGETCLLANIYPEVKLVHKDVKEPKVSEPFERDYLDYTTDPRTVLMGDACDVLGGEFCKPPYKM